MKLFDCFTFFNELELLEIRLHELAEVVDYFVIVESSYGFSGKSKSLFFQNNKERFSEFLHKIIHIVVEYMPNDGNPWNNEEYQRQAVWRGLGDAKPGDLIIISDADEIPRASAITQKIDSGFDDYNVFEQELAYGHVNTMSEKWHGSKSFIFDGNKDIDLTHDIRHKKMPHQEDIIIKNGGWHFSYLGGTERIATKIKNFSHQELNNAKVLNNKRLQDCLDNNINPVHGDKLVFQEIDDTYPKYLIDNKERFSRLIKK